MANDDMNHGDFQREKWQYFRVVKGRIQSLARFNEGHVESSQKYFLHGLMQSASIYILSRFWYALSNNRKFLKLHIQTLHETVEPK